jgi:undecaprenyl diphosphate synthase
MTLYAFSSDNWRRPKQEVDALMTLLDDYLRRETAECTKQGVRLRFLGRRDRLPWSLRGAMQRAESETAACRRLLLQIAVDYSSRDAILDAASSGGSRADIDARSAGDVDLLIRTGGEQRLSDFLLWECAYAELLFLPVMWPDFTAADLDAAVRQFEGRQRRFGQVAPAAG